MSKRSSTMLVLACILVAAGLFGRLVPDSAPPAEAKRILLRNAGGRVVFTHAAHIALEDGKCMICHHEPAAFGNEAARPGIGECGSCHLRSEDTAFAAAHRKQWSEAGGDVTCASCHHTTLVGLSEKWSHEDHFGYASDDCQACHHGEDIEPSPQACRDCHSPEGAAAKIPLREAVHARCEPCHADKFEAKLTGCADCHELKRADKSLAEGAPAANFPACASCHFTMPARMDAFHQNCMGCHEKVGKGPAGADQCKQCHTP